MNNGKLLYLLNSKNTLNFSCTYMSFQLTKNMFFSSLNWAANLQPPLQVRVPQSEKSQTTWQQRQHHPSPRQDRKVAKVLLKLKVAAMLIRRKMKSQKFKKGLCQNYQVKGEKFRGWQVVMAQWWARRLAIRVVPGSNPNKGENLLIFD